MKLTKFVNMQIIVDFQEFSASTKFDEYVISFAYLLIHFNPILHRWGHICSSPLYIVYNNSGNTGSSKLKFSRNEFSEVSKKIFFD